jgi:hypothetical protein
LVIVGAAVLGLSLTSTHGTRAFEYDGDPKLALYQADAGMIWRHAPNTELHYVAPEFSIDIRLNGDGFRDQDEPSRLDAPTVLFIGDSFTFGWGVSSKDSLIGLIQQQITDSRPRLQFINAGVNSFAFDQQLLMLKRLIATRRPVLVVQGLYWPHIRSLFDHREARGTDGRLVAVSDPSIRIDERGVLWNRRGANRDAGDWISYFRHSTLNEDLWRRTDRLVQETIEVVTDAKVAYLPFLIPTNVEVGAMNWAALGWREVTPPDNIDLSLPVARLAAMFRGRGVDVIDLTGPMRGTARASRPSYYPQDGHWTTVGHALAAGILASHVASLAPP